MPKGPFDFPPKGWEIERIKRAKREHGHKWRIYTMEPEWGQFTRGTFRRKRQALNFAWGMAIEKIVREIENG